MRAASQSRTVEWSCGVDVQQTVRASCPTSAPVAAWFSMSAAPTSSRPGNGKIFRQAIYSSFQKRKSLLNKLLVVVYFTLSTLKPSTLPPKLSKTGQITPLVGFGRRFCYSNMVLSLSFLFISTKSLKNHSKSQKNHKMKNLILLDSMSRSTQ